VLDLVRETDKGPLIDEMFRVLKPGGRIAVSDIVSDETVPGGLEAAQAILYERPWKAVSDDDGHTLERGIHTAVCAKTSRILSGEPYADETIGIEPMNPVPENTREEFDCSRTEPRDPRETESADDRISKPAEGSCC